MEFEWKSCLSACSSVLTDLPLWWEMLVIKGENIWDIDTLVHIAVNLNFFLKCVLLFKIEILQPWNFMAVQF